MHSPAACLVGCSDTPKEEQPSALALERSQTLLGFCLFVVAVILRNPFQLFTNPFHIYLLAHTNTNLALIGFLAFYIQ